MDRWRIEKAVDLGVVTELTHSRFRVGREALRETDTIPGWLGDIIDWGARLAADPSSMLMPVRASAVGDDGHGTADRSSSSPAAVRQVLGVSFPSLCLMLMASHSAAELEAAFERMPLVRPGKVARGWSKRQKPHAGP